MGDHELKYYNIQHIFDVDLFDCMSGKLLDNISVLVKACGLGVDAPGNKDIIKEDYCMNPENFESQAEKIALNQLLSNQDLVLWDDEIVTDVKFQRTKVFESDEWPNG